MSYRLPSATYARLMVTLLIVAVVIWIFWMRAAVGCWQRGGTALRNAFDWPVCIEVPRR